jgi:hypothetical protein
VRGTGLQVAYALRTPVRNAEFWAYFAKEENPFRLHARAYARVSARVEATVGR